MQPGARTAAPTRAWTAGTAPATCASNIAAVVAAIDDGVPVAGYWHWSLVDNYEWGSYEPRFGLYGVDRHRGEHGHRAGWTTDALGDDAAGAYRRIIAGLGPATGRCSAT